MGGRPSSTRGGCLGTSVTCLALSMWVPYARADHDSLRSMFTVTVHGRVLDVALCPDRTGIGFVTYGGLAGLVGPSGQLKWTTRVVAAPGDIREVEVKGIRGYCRFLPGSLYVAHSANRNRVSRLDSSNGAMKWQRVAGVNERAQAGATADVMSAITRDDVPSGDRLSREEAATLIDLAAKYERARAADPASGNLVELVARYWQTTATSKPSSMPASFAAFIELTDFVQATRHRQEFMANLHRIVESRIKALLPEKPDVARALTGGTWWRSSELLLDFDVLTFRGHEAFALHDATMTSLRNIRFYAADDGRLLQYSHVPVSPKVLARDRKMLLPYNRTSGGERFIGYCGARSFSVSDQKNEVTLAVCGRGGDRWGVRLRDWVMLGSFGKGGDLSWVSFEFNRSAALAVWANTLLVVQETGDAIVYELSRNPPGASEIARQRLVDGVKGKTVLAALEGGTGAVSIDDQLWMWRNTSFRGPHRAPATITAVSARGTWAAYGTLSGDVAAIAVLTGKRPRGAGGNRDPVKRGPAADKR